MCLPAIEMKRQVTTACPTSKAYCVGYSKREVPAKSAAKMQRKHPQGSWLCEETHPWMIMH